MTTLYGISNCDSVKKAQKWLKQNNIAFTFHDFRKDGLDETLLSSFFEYNSWEALLNKRSTSYRNLSEEQKMSINQQTVTALFIEFPTLIKRPVLLIEQQSLIGFKPDLYQDLFSA